MDLEKGPNRAINRTNININIIVIRLTYKRLRRTDYKLIIDLIAP
jgi:hypothetical protein